MAATGTTGTDSAADGSIGADPPEIASLAAREPDAGSGFGFSLSLSRSFKPVLVPGRADGRVGAGAYEDVSIAQYSC
jgi:hypothetical protein